MSSNKTWFRVHSFTGVITGLFLFVICWSGTIAVFSYEIDWLVTPAWRVEATSKPLDWSVIRTAAQEAYPRAQVIALNAPLYPGAAATVWLRRDDGRNLRAFVDARNGVVTGVTSGYTVQRFFRNLHRRLFFPNPWGVCLMALFGLTMLASLVASLKFYKRWWRRFFRFTPGRGRRLWSEVHKLAGLWSLWFVLLIALTGVWYGIEQIRIHGGDGISVFTGSRPAFSQHTVPQPAPAGDDKAWLPLATLMDRVQAVRPDMQVDWVRIRQDGRLYVHGQSDHLLVRSRANQLWLDGRTGEVLYDQRASDLPPYWRWVDTADPLHFGSFGGLISKAIWFLFGLLLCGLILTGTYLHAHRLVQGRSGMQRYRWPGTLAAVVVSLSVLAASVPVARKEAHTFFGPESAGDPVPLLAPGVQAVIVGWVAVTVLILAFWVGLLWKPDRWTRPTNGVRCRR